MVLLFFRKVLVWRNGERNVADEAETMREIASKVVMSVFMVVCGPDRGVI